MVYHFEDAGEIESTPGFSLNTRLWGPQRLRGSGSDWSQIDSESMNHDESEKISADSYLVRLDEVRVQLYNSGTVSVPVSTVTC